MGVVQYYISSSGENPVKDFIELLGKEPKAKIFRLFMNIEQYGLVSVLPHVKKLAGTDLWEIRILGRDNIRILYVVVAKDGVLALNGFVKKSQKTPKREIAVAMSRYNEWKHR